MSQKRTVRGGGEKCHKSALCPQVICSFVSRHNLKNNSSYIPENMKGLACVLKTNTFSVRWELNAKNIVSQRFDVVLTVHRL
jgi:hypothetical protein